MARMRRRHARYPMPHCAFSGKAWGRINVRGLLHKSMGGISMPGPGLTCITTPSLHHRAVTEKLHQVASLGDQQHWVSVTTTCCWVALTCPISTLLGLWEWQMKAELCGFLLETPVKIFSHSGFEVAVSGLATRVPTMVNASFCSSKILNHLIILAYYAVWNSPDGFLWGRELPASGLFMGKMSLGQSASGDVEITQFYHDGKWPQTPALFLWAWEMP